MLAVVATTASEALCPLCQCRSEHIHSRSVRFVADLPWAGWAVRLDLPVRRCFCPNTAGLRQSVPERVPSVVAPSVKVTLPVGMPLPGETALTVAVKVTS